MKTNGDWMDFQLAQCHQQEMEHQAQNYNRANDNPHQHQGQRFAQMIRIWMSDLTVGLNHHQDNRITQTQEIQAAVTQ